MHVQGFFSILSRGGMCAIIVIHKGVRLNNGIAQCNYS